MVQVEYTLDRRSIQSMWSESCVGCALQGKHTLAQCCRDAPSRHQHLPDAGRRGKPSFLDLVCCKQ